MYPLRFSGLGTNLTVSRHQWDTIGCFMTGRFLIHALAVVRYLLAISH